MWHLRSLHTFHLCRRRALRQRTLQVRESRLRAFGDHLHRPVAQVAGESPEPQTRRLAPHPPAEPHALDVAVHEEAHGTHSGPTLAAPARPAGGTTRCRSPRSPPAPATRRARRVPRDRKSTRLNSSHDQISYAVFCLKKKRTTSHCTDS